MALSCEAAAAAGLPRLMTSTSGNVTQFRRMRKQRQNRMVDQFEFLLRLKESTNVHDA
jgi:hypothetical protein